MFENFEVNKCNDIDVRYIRVVYEHFISMKMKLKYFDEMGVVFKQQKEMVKFYDFAEIEAKVALMKGNATEQAVASVLDLVGYNYFPYTYDSGHPGWKMFGSETSSAVRSRGVYKTPTNQNILTAMFYL